MALVDSEVQAMYKATITTRELVTLPDGLHPVAIVRARILAHIHCTLTVSASLTRICSFAPSATTTANAPGGIRNHGRGLQSRGAADPSIEIIEIRS